jgi:simple sugar transport system substrate-binding protein
MLNTTRRKLITGAAAASGVAAAAGVAALPGVAWAAKPYRVAYVYVAPIGDAGYTYQHELGRRAVQAHYGSAVKTSYVENVPEGADAERVIRKLAQANDLVFTTSFGFMEPTLKVARQYPRVKFEHATGYKRAANVATYSARFYEGRFLAGVIAGRMTKSNVIGFVGAFPIPEVINNLNAYTLGARSVNPAVQVKLVMVSAWFDPGKERAAAETMMSQGADVVVTHTDSPAVQQAGEDRGVWTVGFDSDMSRFGPKTCLTSQMDNWADYYIQRVGLGMAGKWHSTDTWGGIKAGMIQLAPFNPVTPKAVVDEIMTKKAAIADGSLKPFAGPVVDQSGKTRVAAGSALTDGDILGMNWLVQGVQGSV